MVVVGVSRATNGGVPVRLKTGGPSFGVRAERAGPAEMAAPAGGVAISSLLAMQEAESGLQQDREARRHGDSMMDELSELQLALLGGSEADLGRLVRLLARPVRATDPYLAALLRSIRTRAGIELARRGIEASG